MHRLLLTLATTPSPDPTAPSLRPGLTEDQVTPGTWGFVLTAFIVVLTTLLIVDMVRRIRRVRYRGQVEEARLAAETAGSGDAPAGDAAAGDAPADADGDAAPGAR